ncbi:MAG: hypothetical protein ACYC27_14770 [Armatimonadota bacterium]
MGRRRAKLETPEGKILREFLDLWWEKHQDQNVSTSVLFPLVFELDYFPIGETETLMISFGQMIGKLQDQIIGDYKIVRAGSKMRAVLWQLVKDS